MVFGVGVNGEICWWVAEFW